MIKFRISLNLTSLGRNGWIKQSNIFIKLNVKLLSYVGIISLTFFRRNFNDGWRTKKTISFYENQLLKLPQDKYQTID